MEEKSDTEFCCGQRMTIESMESTCLRVGNYDNPTEYQVFEELRCDICGKESFNEYITN